MYHQVIAAMTAIAVLSFGGAHDRVQAANDSALKADILRLSHDWERVKFQVADRAEQEKQIAILELQAGDIAKRYPNHPEAIIWIGFIISEQASMAIESGGPIKALGLAMRARDILEDRPRDPGCRSTDDTWRALLSRSRISLWFWGQIKGSALSPRSN